MALNVPSPAKLSSIPNQTHLNKLIKSSELPESYRKVSLTGVGAKKKEDLFSRFPTFAMGVEGEQQSG